MTNRRPFDTMELFPIPEGAVELNQSIGAKGHRSIVVDALRNTLQDRRLTLSLGPETALHEEGHHILINGFCVQLITAGILADQLEVDPSDWMSAIKSPQLVLAALVDEENALVFFPGVLTAQELLTLLSGVSVDKKNVILDTYLFNGGIDRLLTLVQLLQPDALPSIAMSSSFARGRVRSVVAVMDWLLGRIDDALSSIGGELKPITAGAFRSGGIASDTTDDAIALLRIPFGLSGEELVSGDAALRCVRQFHLDLILSGSDQPSELVVLIRSSISGALLPDGLLLEVRQGIHRQFISSSTSTELKLIFDGSNQLLDVSLRFGESTPVELPSLKLPA